MVEYKNPFIPMKVTIRVPPPAYKAGQQHDITIIHIHTTENPFNPFSLHLKFLIIHPN